ncbi:hypothetical protein JHL21_03345 [Devosia sp. WQ 349]|nr:hypothetical protein [Devosia sp. WQ 349K1]
MSYRLHWYSLSADQTSAAIRDGVQRGLSTGEMGTDYGCTRNVILSHARRNRIQLASRVYKTKRVERSRSPFPVMVALPAITWEPHREPVALVDLEAHHCRWPVGDGAGAAQRFCGDLVVRGSYCERHAAVSQGASLRA